MRIAAMRPQPGTTTVHASLHGAAGHAPASILRPRITEDISSGAQDGESLWMASAWRGDSGSGTNDQPASAAASRADSSTQQRNAPDPTAPGATPPAGSRISFWA